MVKKKSGLDYFVFLIVSLFLLAASNLAAYEITNDFESPNALLGFQVDGWGIRSVDSCAWGPQNAPSGTHAVGVPEDCQSGYPNGNPSQVWNGTLTSPALALTSIFPSLYIGFSYWADFEGVTATFDGVILELINETQDTTVQIDPNAESDLCPTYDDIIGTTNPTLQGLWAYCYDTLAPRFNSLGYPFLVIQSRHLGQEAPGHPEEHPNMPTDFEWRTLTSVDLIAAGYASSGDTVRFRWTFASDQLANGAGYFFDDLIISSDPPTDLQPPAIDVTTPEMWANIADSSAPTTVSAEIVEGCGGSGVNPDSVFMVWEIEGTPQTDIAMTNTAGDTYEGDVPAQPYDTDIRYRVSATDNQGNKGSSPWRHMEVTDAITLSWDDGIPASVFPDLEMGDGFAVRFTASAEHSYLIHKVMYYFGSPDALFDVVVNSDGGGIPGAELYHDYSVTNGEVANTFFEYEFSAADSVIISPNQAFHVGMRLASPDTSLDPQQLSDGSGQVNGESWVLAQSQGGWSEVPDGETMIRCKVKEVDIVGTGDNGDGGALLPRAYSLGQNFPNPFNPSTTIRFAIPARNGVENAVPTRLSIYNLRGQLVKTMVDEEMNPGEYSVQWNGMNEKDEPTGSGIYLYRLEAGDFNSTRKMVIVK